MNGAMCVGCGGPLIHAAALCPTCTAPTAAAQSDPWATERVPQSTSYLHRLVVPELKTRVMAVSSDLTSVAMVLSLVVMAVGVASVFVTYATVDGMEVSVASDRSAALAILGSSLAGVLAAFVARGPSGWGVGVLAGSSTSVMFLHQRLAAGVLADGTAVIDWGPGFMLMSVAAVAALGTFLIALTGVRTGQRVTQIPSLVAIPVLALVVAALSFERTNLLDAAYALGVEARAVTAAAVFLEGVLWVSAVAARSRLGAGMLFGGAIGSLIVALDGAQPPRGLLSTAGLADAASVGAVGGLLMLGSLVMAVCAWPEDHPIRRSLTHANDVARLS